MNNDLEEAYDQLDIYHQHMVDCLRSKGFRDCFMDCPDYRGCFAFGMYEGQKQYIDLLADLLADR